MSIKPIDLQTNIAQMGEVGKNEQAKTESVVEQQHVLEKESDKKSKLVNTKLDEAKKGEESVIKDEQKKEEKKHHAGGEQGDENSTSLKEKKKRSVDDRMGNIIDILK